MGLGEYTSVSSANEQVAAEVAKERRELERNPEAEAWELAEAWVRRGAARGARRAGRGGGATNPEEALRVHVREELGVDPDDRPSPWTAAISSFVCFSIGALVPLLPYLLGVHLALAGARLSARWGSSWPARSLPASPASPGGQRRCVSCCSVPPPPAPPT